MSAILLPWLNNFMSYYLKDVYSDRGWEINIDEMDRMRGASQLKKTKSKTRKLYPSKYKLINYIELHNF